MPRPRTTASLPGLARRVVAAAVADAGLRVPDDIAVIGIDDIAASRLRHISLTTISSAAHAMGTRAVQLLVARIAEGETTPPRHVEIEPTLILRGSCGSHP